MVLQELIMLKHLMMYKKLYQYDPVSTLDFITVYDQLMEGYLGDKDQDAIFQSYINALKEDPHQYMFVSWSYLAFIYESMRVDAQNLKNGPVVKLLVH
ncbi:hypothetical protein V6N13_126615 [Hibiscus sabdariffa]|uniref:Uncharacterized protein n=1 Tax=Hibiscus sabdariffa TaxID=183260 RepID=A0ABR2RFJ2_9ROSI